MTWKCTSNSYASINDKKLKTKKGSIVRNVAAMLVFLHVIFVLLIILFYRIVIIHGVMIGH